MLVHLYPLCCHVAGGHYGLVWGAFNGILIPTLNPDPRLYDQRRIVRKEGLHRGPRLGRPVMPFLLELRLDLPAQCLDASLVAVPAPACHNHDIYELLGLR